MKLGLGISFILALAVHGCLLAVLAINVSLDRPQRPEDKPGQIMHATVVNMPPAKGSPTGQASAPKPVENKPAPKVEPKEDPVKDEQSKDDLIKQVDAQKKAEEERSNAIALKKAQEEKAKAEAKRKAEAEAKRKAEEKAKAEAEAKRKAEEKAKAEAEAKRKAEEKAKAEAEAKRKAEEKAKAEAEAKRKAEEKAKAEAEAKRKAEEKAKAEAEALLQQEIAQAQQAQQQAQQQAMQQAQQQAQQNANALENEIFGTANGVEGGQGLGSGDGSDDRLTYGNKVRQLIEQNWRIDPSMNGRRVVVTITVDSGGMIVSQKCDGDKAVCSSALSTINLIGMMPMPPAGCKDCNTIVITMTPRI